MNFKADYSIESRIERISISKVAYINSIIQYTYFEIF